MAVQRSVVSSAKLIAICTLTSRFTGLARDVLLAHAFGLGWVQDAFQYAFQFPNLFRRLFGEGAMAPVFVPTFTRTLEHEGPEAAWRVLARTLALLTVALATLVVLVALVIAAIWLLWPCPADKLADRELLLSLTALMLPFILTICVVALLSSILNCVHSFVPAALMPVILNLSMIAAISWLGPWLFPAGADGTQWTQAERGRVYVIALSVVAAGVLQIIILMPVLRANGVRLGWKLDLHDTTVRHMLRLLPPVALGQGVLAFGVFLDAQICTLLTHVANTPETVSFLGLTFRYPLEEGALSAVTYAQRLYQFPLGVLVISLATAALPAFTRLAARQDWPAWMGEVRQALRLAVFEGVLAGVLLILLAVPMVRFLFQYGEFSAADSQRAGYVVMWYGFGLWAFCAQHIVLRAFYSLGDVRTPLRIAAVLLPVNVAINLSLVWVSSIREAAFAISTCATSSVVVVIGLILLQRRLHARVFDRATILAGVKILIAGAVAGVALAATHPLLKTLTDQIHHEFVSRACETLGGVAIGTGVFLLVALLVRLPEVGLLLRRRSH